MFTAKNVNRWTFSLHLLHLRIESEDNSLHSWKQEKWWISIVTLFLRMYALEIYAHKIKEAMYEVSRVNVKVEPCITSILFAGVNFKRVST